VGKDDTFLNVQMGDYQLKELLAVGGMSRVYIGVDERLERKAAIKVLKLDQDWVNETIVERFEREAKAVAALEHDNVITIYQYDKQDAAYFLAMQYIDGPDLRQVLKHLRSSGKLMEIGRAIRIMQQVASALDYAHMAEIIHRDIKPSNILLSADDKAVLTDFGLVLRPSVDQTLGTAFGTPRYIAPEQAVASQQANAQSDIYSLAVIMYEILTGATPFDGETPMEIALAHVSDEPDPPSQREPSVPHSVDQILLQALGKEPSERPATATDFVNAIAEAYQNAGMLSKSISASQPPPTPPPPQAKKAIVQQQPKALDKGISISAPIQPQNTSVVAEKPARSGGGGRWGLLVALGLLVVAALGVGAYWLTNNESALAVPGVIAEENLALYYDDEALVVHNISDEAITDTQQLDFVRGAEDDGSDDYSGDRIPSDRLAAGACFRIIQQGRVPVERPQCDEISGQESLTNSELFFWRTEPVNQASFEVRWDDTLLQRCDTIQRGENGECFIAIPVADAAEES